MTKDRSILIKNIYYMLTYAFHVLKQDNYEEIETEAFENIYDMFAAILGRGVARLLKQGLYREYVAYEDYLVTKRGKIDLQKTIKSQMSQTPRLYCEFDELTVNNLLNRILKTTMGLLLRHPDVKTGRKALLKKNLLYFGEVDFINYMDISWPSILFQRNNQSYRMLINICSLVIKGMLLSTEKGSIKWATFIDEQRMCRLYEKFILEYYKYHHRELSPQAARIPWNLDDGSDDLLPVMQTDITLRTPSKVLIIDAKYYSSMMQSHFGVHTVHSDNLYQIFTYVKNLDRENTGRVSGMLLYARTEEKNQPDHSYLMGGNRIMVKSLDLNLPFTEIARQLDTIVERELSD